MRGYRVACREVIEARFEGHIVQLKGDGTLSIFGFPVAHENDAERAVRAGLALVRAVRDLSPVTTSIAGEALDVRVAVHHGPVYVDFDEDDIYGLAANVGARLHALADPGTVLVSDDVRRLVEDCFEIEAGDPQVVKGVAEPLESFRVVGERPLRAQRSWSTPLVERETELERLRRAWAPAEAGDRRARDGSARHAASAGVGKSRLVAALADDVRAAAGCRRAAPRLSLPRGCGLPSGPEPGRGALWHPRGRRRRRAPGVPQPRGGGPGARPGAERPPPGTRPGHRSQRGL